MNVEAMLLNDVEKKARKESCQNYIDSDYFKMIFTDECVFKCRKHRSRDGIAIKKALSFIDETKMKGKCMGWI